MEKNRKLTKLQKEDWLLFLSGLLLYVLLIFASIGAVLSILIIINGRLPQHISLFEYLMLILAVLLAGPVFLWHKRLRASIKNKE